MFAYVGCYTTPERHGRGDGINVYRVDRDGWAHVQLVKDAPNPSWLELDRQQRTLYAAHGDGETISAFRIDADTGRLEELGSQATGGLTPLQVITTLPTSFTGNSTTSEIAVACGGRFVYASNRGHDSIVVFGLDEATGVLTPLGWEPTQGRTPRFFAIEPSDTVLCVANQDSDSIVTFTIDGATGGLAPTGQVVRTGSPSSIVFRAVR